MTFATTQITSARTLGEMSAIQWSLPAPKFEFVGDLADLEKHELVAARRDSACSACSACSSDCVSGCSNCACGACNCTGCSGCNGNCSSCTCTG
jgi:hypothetical protein